MIDRIFIKDNILFKDVELGFKKSDTKSIKATISNKLDLERYSLEDEKFRVKCQGFGAILILSPKLSTFSLIQRIFR